MEDVRKKYVIEENSITFQPTCSLYRKYPFDDNVKGLIYSYLDVPRNISSANTLKQSLEDYINFSNKDNFPDSIYRKDTKEVTLRGKNQRNTIEVIINESYCWMVNRKDASVMLFYYKPEVDNNENDQKTLKAVREICLKEGFYSENIEDYETKEGHYLKIKGRVNYFKKMMKVYSRMLKRIL